MCNNGYDRCYVVPPYLLKAISESSENSEQIRNAAAAALSAREKVTASRHEQFAAASRPRGYRHTQSVLQNRQSIVPEQLLKHLAESEDVDEKTRKCARRDLEHLKKVHESVKVMQQEASVTTSDQKTLKGSTAPKQGAGEEDKTETFYRAVYDAGNSEDESTLPGKLIRAEGQQKATDKAVNEAYDNVGHVLHMYKELFNWQSIDNQNMHVVSSVHFGENYENAFWDPSVAQMVFGDGGDFLYKFTACLDVIGHELTHAVTEHTSPLDYQGQSGALNEHISDVFGIMVKQRVENEKVEKADWLIGEGCLMPDVKGLALRSMKAPGTAYNDPRFGKDPQPDNYKDYRATMEDNGGVHIYSGIPNKAFYLASMAFGGYSWEKAGKIWWETMNSGRIPPRCTFLQFADVTVEVAEELFDDDAAKIVAKAWKDVGVQKRVR